jgi:hypothetical protein
MFALHPWLWCNDINGCRILLMMLIFWFVLSLLWGNVQWVSYVYYQCRW